MRTLCLALVIGSILASCSAGPAEQEVVGALAGEAFLPALAKSATAAEGLAAAADSFCANPSGAAHETAKAAWLTTETSWEAAELLSLFGPADMLRTMSKVDYSPISESGIDELLASDTTIDVGYVDDMAASTVRGLGAVEYALYRELDAAADPRLCELSTATSEVVAAEMTALHDAWQGSAGGGAGFLEEFTVTMTTNQALADVVGAIVETLKRQSLFELGKALAISSVEPEVGAIPEGAAGAGAAVYAAQLEGIRAALEAGSPDSLSGLIGARDQATAERIDGLLASAITQLSAVDKPLREVAASDPDALQPLYEKLSELRTLFEADVVSLLDVTLGFSDTDGDSG